MKFGLIQGEVRFDSHHKIGLVTSKFNSQVTEPLEQSALHRLNELGVGPENIFRLRVPGALELPLAVKWLFENCECDGVVALGAVIRGETTHYDLVCEGSERGCMQVQLELGKPVAFGVLTTENKQQAMARVDGSKGAKGKEAVEVVAEMLNLSETLITKRR